MFCHHLGWKWSAGNAFLIKSHYFLGLFFFFANLAATLITSPAAVDPALWHSVWQPLTDANLLLLLPANSVTCRHDWHHGMSVYLSLETALYWSGLALNGKVRGGGGILYGWKFYLRCQESVEEYQVSKQLSPVSSITVCLSECRNLMIYTTDTT